MQFTLKSGTTLYLDKNGKTSCVLDADVSVTIASLANNQQLAEILIGTSGPNFALNASSLEYLSGDNLQKFGAAGVPIDVGSASPSSSTSPSASLSPSASASPSASGSRSPSASASPSVSTSLSPSASASPSLSVSLSPSVSPSRSPSASPSAS